MHRRAAPNDSDRVSTALRRLVVAGALGAACGASGALAAPVTLDVVGSTGGSRRA